MNPKILLNTITLRRSSSALGDNLVLSFLAHEIKKRYPHKKVVVETEWPDLFFNNPFIDEIRKGKKAKIFYFKPKYILPSSDGTHILHQLTNVIGIDSTQTPPYVELFLQEEEIEKMRNKLPKRFITVCPSGTMVFAGNRKEWDFYKFQQVIDSMKEIEFVQIGVPSDPLLNGVLDYRKTNLPVRTSAAIIKLSSAGLFIEGGLGHLARSVNKASVIIYGGALDPNHTGYKENINLSTVVDCSNCFTSLKAMGNCDHKKCMDPITSDLVVSMLRKLI